MRVDPRPLTFLFQANSPLEFVTLHIRHREQVVLENGSSLI